MTEKKRDVEIPDKESKDDDLNKIFEFYNIDPLVIINSIRRAIERKCCITVGLANDPAITLYDVFEILDNTCKEIADMQELQKERYVSFVNLRYDIEQAKIGCSQPVKNGLDYALHIMDSEPSESAKKTWIDTGSGQECPYCHKVQEGYDSFRNFCANCGAKLK